MPQKPNAKAAEHDVLRPLRVLTLRPLLELFFSNKDHLPGSNSNGKN